ncbi:MAG: hypothetical protein ABIG93_01815 [archaeon]|nr:hypothetical protein [Nanoarchaeota archaeon]
MLLNKKAKQKSQNIFSNIFTNKRGMAISQVFVFIVAAITFAFVLIFGYNAVSDFLDKGETVEFYQFKSSLENTIVQIYSEYGAVRQEDYYLPTGYEQICFVDLDFDYSQATAGSQFDELCKKDPIACDVWETARNSETPGYAGADENVFLQPSAPVALKVYKIELHNAADERVGYLCQDIDKGHFTLRLEGKGSKTLLTEIVYE